MKKTRIIIAASALLLGVGSFVVNSAHATKHAVHKNGAAVSAYFKTASGTWITLFSGGTPTGCKLTSRAISGQTARFKTGGGTGGVHTVFSNTAGGSTHVLYYN